MSDELAPSLVRSYFERWQRLEEEKAVVAEDLKNLFAEAKGNGFDTKAMRAVFRAEVGDKAEKDEFDAICELYRAALAGPRAHPAPARTREAQKSDATSQVRPAAALPAVAGTDVGGTSAPSESASDAISEPIQVSGDTGQERDGAAASAIAGIAAVAPCTPSLADGADEIASINSLSALTSSQASEKAAEPVPPPGGSAAAPSAMTAKTKADVIRLLRPHCQHPDELERCAGQGAKHCHGCNKAAEASQAPGGHPIHPVHLEARA